MGYNECVYKGDVAIYIIPYNISLYNYQRCMSVNVKIKRPRNKIYRQEGKNIRERERERESCFSSLLTRFIMNYNGCEKEDETLDNSYSRPE